MITSTHLITHNLPDMGAYYSHTVQQLAEGKTNLARGMFKALSLTQRKAFFFHISKEWQITAGDTMYDFFYEMF